MFRALLTVTAVLVLAPSAQAAILQVDTDADVAIANPADCTDANTGTPCSVRDALAAAGATMEDDRVLLPADDYVLNGTSLQVTGPGEVTIVGEGAATTTLDGNDASTVLDVFVSATIEGVTIRDGHTALQGGGVLVNDGTFVVRNSVIESNEAGTAPGEMGQGGGIALGAAAARVERSVIRDNKAGFAGGGIWTASNSDPLTLIDSTVASNHAGPATGGPAIGGGIRAEHALSLVRVALTGNDATAISTGNDSASGGGLIALDELTIVDSTVTGNSALGTNGGEARGGGLYIAGSEPVQISGSTLAANTAAGTGGTPEAGAIRQFGTGQLTVTNSTLSGNSVSATAGANGASGGGAVIDTSATLTNVTIVGNSATGTMPSGGNLVTPNAALRNTLVAGGVPANCSFTVASAVGSLDSGTSCGLGAGNRSGITNPRLGPLAANGGPTRTHALLTGSPAIDAGTRTGAPAADQRGVRRPQRAGVDIGAYELLAPPPSGGPLPDRTAPALADLGLTRQAFRTRRGTTVRYSLSEAATVTFRVQRRTTGRRVGGRCVKRTKANRSRQRCVRFVRLRGRLTDHATAGANELRFRGRLRGRRLPPGLYRLVATAVDEAGNRSAPARVAFRILGRPRQ